MQLYTFITDLEKQQLDVPEEGYVAGWQVRVDAASTLYNRRR